jgi:hypothetical protein
MGRGKAAEVGAERVSQNGYRYVKCESGWRLKHHLIAEEILGRPLKDNEIVKFRGVKTNFAHSNIEVIVKRTSSLRKRKAQLESRIADLQAELDSVNKSIENHSESND